MRSEGVVIVRPHGDRIRLQVIETLRRASFRVVGVVEPGTSVRVAVEEALASRVQRFVVPFHAHRDHAGVLGDGLEITRAILDRVDARVLMPVSVHASAAVELARARGEVPPAVLTLGESELGSPETPARVREHLLSPVK